MTTPRQLVGTLIVVILAPAIAWGQVGTTTNPPAPPAPIRDAATVTNAPSATPLTVPQPAVAGQPAEPQITVPHPAQVEIPSATVPPAVSSAPAPRPHATPLMPPTARELLSRSIQSAPGGSQDKLNTITAAALALSPTNAGTATPDSESPSSTNWSAGQPNIWQKKSPSPNDVNYHW